MDYNRVKVAKSANVVKEAVLLGDVTVGEDCCILFHAVLRGDEDRIVVGKCSNIQDNCTVHADVGYPAVIGDYVTVGHNALVHGCKIGDGTLVGMGSIVMNGTVVGKECLIGAGSLVLQNQKIPDGSLVLGNPAKVVRALTEKERKGLYESSDCYLKVGRELREGGYVRTFEE